MISRVKIISKPIVFITLAMLWGLLLFLDARLCLAFSIGLGLTACGATLQSLFKNPLADPYIIGVSGGASLFGSMAMMLLDGQDPWLIPAASMLGSLLVCIALSKITHNESVILAGLLVNAFASALISLFKTLMPATQTQSLIFWLLGTVTPLGFKTLVGVGLTILVGVFVLIYKSDVIANIDTVPDPVFEKRMIHVTVSIIVGVIISFCGFIGFVGLLVPQIVRILFGNDPRILIPISAISGACILVVCDALSQITHIQTGVLTALLGTPVFGFMAYMSHSYSKKQPNPQNRPLESQRLEY